MQIRFFNLASFVPSLARLLTLTDAFWGAAGSSLEIVMAPVDPSSVPVTQRADNRGGNESVGMTFDFSNFTIPATATTSPFDLTNLFSSPSTLNPASIFDIPPASATVFASVEKDDISLHSTLPSDKREELNTDIFVFQCEGSQLLRVFTSTYY